MINFVFSFYSKSKEIRGWDNEGEFQQRKFNDYVVQNFMGPFALTKIMGG